MGKEQLKDGMVVKSSGGRYGVVCIKDATDEKVIKFLYDPALLIEHGYVKESGYGDAIVPLENFDEQLQIWYTDPEDQQRYIAWSIVQVFELHDITQQLLDR